jgi:hypothetical protein
MKNRPVFFVLSILLVLIVFIGGVVVGVYKLPPYKTMSSIKDVGLAALRTPTPVPSPTAIPPAPTPDAGEAALLNIVSLIRDQYLSPTAELDFIREFVHVNSIHLIDEEFDEYAYNTPRVLSMMFAYFQSEGSAPHLACDTRVYAMEAIVAALDYDKRVIMFFSDEVDNFAAGHAVLEVLNPDSGRWEVQDPDYNVYFTRRDNPAYRLSATELLTMPPQEVEALSPDENLAVDAQTVLVPTYFEAMVCLYRGPESYALVNAKRFEAAKLQGQFPGETDAYLLFRDYVWEHFGEFPLVVLGGAAQPE